MCDFTWLGVRHGDPHLVPRPDGLARAVMSMAATHGLKLASYETRAGSALDRMLADCQLRFHFQGGDCACDWGAAEFHGVRALAKELLDATQVKRVVFAHYMVSGRDLETPGGKKAPDVVEVSRDALEAIELRSRVVTVRRAEGDWPHVKLEV